MNELAERVEIEPYTLLRTALALFRKTPEALNADEHEQVIKQAAIELSIETLVLNSAEAASVIIPDEELENAVNEIAERFTDESDFLKALEANQLNPDSLRVAILRQCKVENVLEKIAFRAKKISDVEVGIYYYMHPEKFNAPEIRSVSHILITINDQFKENSREAALQRISTVAETLKRKPHKFADLAMKNSECPTAMQGGQLGDFPRGKLYPEIDAVLFKLKKGQISEVVETEAGFHVLLCTAIKPAETLSFSKAQRKIRRLLQERSQRTCQRAWLASLSDAQTPND